MLTEVRVLNPNRPDLELLVLSLLQRSRFQISFIDGLGPVNAEISSSPYANLDGDVFQSSRVGPRNIVLTLELFPFYSDNEDSEELRSILYGYFAPKNFVDLTFITTKGIRTISGTVESFESPLFVQKPVVQISMLCMDPYFKANDEKIIVTDISSDTILNIYNEGTVHTGFELIADMTNGGNEFVVSNMSNSIGKPLLIKYVFDPGAIIDVNTNDREKGAVLLPHTSLLPYMTSGSGWPVLNPGPNQLLAGYSYEPGINNITIKFTERFVGI